MPNIQSNLEFLEIIGRASNLAQNATDSALAYIYLVHHDGYEPPNRIPIAQASLSHYTHALNRAKDILKEGRIPRTTCHCPSTTEAAKYLEGFLSEALGQDFKALLETALAKVEALTTAIDSGKTDFTSEELERTYDFELHRKIRGAISKWSRYLSEVIYYPE